MSRWAAAGVVALVFLSGVGIGSLATLALHPHHAPGAERPPEVLPNLRQLERRLDLTPDQVRQLRELHRSAQQDLRELRPQLRREVESVRDAHMSRVLEILDDDQRRRLEEMIERRQSRQRQHRDGRGASPGPPTTGH